MKIVRTLALSILVLCSGANVHAKAQPASGLGGLPEAQVAIEDLSDPAMPGKSFLATTVIDAPVPKLCAIIVDYARYPEFMPNTERTQIVETGGGVSLVDMTLGLPLGKIKKYRLHLQARTVGEECRLFWKLVPREDLMPEETIADTSGYWRLSPSAADRSKTTVEYFVYADPGPVPFGFRWIVDIMSRDALPKTLEALRGRAAAH